MIQAYLDRIQSELHPLRQTLYQHPLYKKLATIDALKQFMTVHVFVVWDFMNLLSHLQQTLTCTTLPWRPPVHPHLARLVNEIKLEEESDIIDGAPISHFQYYVKSMQALGVDTTDIHLFQSQLGVTPYAELLASPHIPSVAGPFLRHTYECIEKGAVETAASFCFGRETLIPTMFIELLSCIEDEQPQVAAFKQYLERHIELDGDQHGDVALQMVTLLCGESGALWARAGEAAKQAIAARLSLYDGISAVLG